MTVIWVIRHGQASFGNSDYDVLSETGIEQSRFIGKYFNKVSVSFDAWYSGSMKRQLDTAKYAAAETGEDVTIREDMCLDEYNFKSIINSQLEDIKKEDPEIESDLEQIFTDNLSFQRVYGKIMKRWMSGSYDKQGVDTFLEFKNRVKGGLFKIADENKEQAEIVLFTSGGVISATMQLALFLSDHEAMRLGWYIQNASISKFKISNGRINLMMFNQMGHLEHLSRPELLTYR